MFRILGLGLAIVLLVSVVTPLTADAVIADSDGNVIIAEPATDDIPRLAEMLISDDPSVSDGARDALETFGFKSVPAIAARLGDPAYLKPAVRALGAISPDGESMDIMRNKLTGNESEKAAACAVLGRWQDMESADAIRDAVVNGSGTVRYYALTGYGDLYRENRSGYDVPAIMKALADPDENTRMLAATLLGRVDLSGYKDELFGAAAGDGSVEIRRAVLAALDGDVGGGDVMRLLELAITETDPIAQSSSVYLLGSLKATEAVPELLALLDGPNGSDYILQREIFIALQEIGKAVDLAAFGKYLGTGDPHHNCTVELLDLMDSQARPGDEALAGVLEEYIGREDYAPNRDRAQGILDRVRK